MTKEEVLIYGMIIQADVFEQGHGIEDEDEKLLLQLLFKIYGATEETPDEEFEKLQEILEDDKKKLAEEYRQKAINFLRG